MIDKTDQKTYGDPTPVFPVDDQYLKLAESQTILLKRVIQHLGEMSRVLNETGLHDLAVESEKLSQIVIDRFNLR